MGYIKEIEQYNEKTKELSDKLVDYIEELLVNAPDNVVSIKWNQYTPHFNDGDPCEFWRNEVSVHFTDTKEDEGDNKDGFLETYNVYSGYNNPKPMTKDQKQKINFINEINKNFDEVPSEFFNNAFGDGNEVIFRRDGSYDSEYHEHD